MAQLDQQNHWAITENIARFQEQLKSETDVCQRRLLEGLLVLEREKLKMIASSPRNPFSATAGKASVLEQAKKEQDDGSPQGF